MSEEKETHENESKSSATVTPASNQNLIIGLVVGAIGLLLLILVLSQQFGKDDSSGELAQIKKDLEAEKARRDGMQYAGMGAIGQNPDILVSQIKADVETLNHLLKANASDATLLRAAQDSVTFLNNEITRLKGELAQSQGAAGRAASLEAELNAARQAAAGMVDSGTVNSLRDQLASATNDRDRLQSELNQLRSEQGNMVDRNTYALMKAENDDMKTTLAVLRVENQRLLAELEGSKLFVSQEDLSPRAVALFRELRRIEPESHLNRGQIYTRIDRELNASIGQTIAFETGKAEIASEQEAELKNMSLSAPENTFFLVVGYASTSGDSKGNEELSSLRATRVASMVNYLKRQGQAVQAVYLGEGKRFGPEDAVNQVCEVWMIRP